MDLAADTAPAPLLHIDHLCRAVDGQTIIDDVTLDVYRGETIAIMGPSGAGKSSLLRLLNRLDEPTGGTVLLDGLDYRTLPPRELRRRVGLVLQAPFLFPGSVADNLRFGPRQRQAPLADDAIARLLERVGLAGYAGRDVRRLSGGEAQRVSLARTLANEPEILLLDEPTSALDSATKREVEALLHAIIRDQRLTCLLVTHDPQQAARLGTRLLLLERGRVRAFDGPPGEVHDQPLP